MPRGTPRRRHAALSVGVNLVWMGERAGGIGRTTVELLGALLEVAPGLRLVAFTGPEVPEALQTAPWAGAVEWVALPARRPQAQLAAQLAALAPLALAHRIDVLHAPATVGPPLAPGIATVSTLYDLIWLHEGDAWGTRRAQRSTRALFTLCARRADRVLTCSEASRHDIATTLGVPEERIDVALLGVAPPPADRPASAPPAVPGAPFVLCVAQRRPYKNLQALVRAIAATDAAHLVLAGAPTAHDAELRALAAALGVADRVQLRDHVSDAELEALYGGAAAFVLPSLMEGFGLPVLEAMARGVPVACADRWSLPEVAGDAALTFDPEDQDAVTGAVRRLLDDAPLRRELAARGRARAAEFTWRRTAEATLESFERARYGVARSWPRGASARA